VKLLRQYTDWEQKKALELSKDLANRYWAKMTAKRKRDEAENEMFYDNQRIGPSILDRPGYVIEAYRAHCRRIRSGKRVPSVMSNDQESVPKKIIEHLPESPFDSKIIEGKIPQLIQCRLIRR
jgi:hypothetical protein